MRTGRFAVILSKKIPSHDSLKLPSVSLFFNPLAMKAIIIAIIAIIGGIGCYISGASDKKTLAKYAEEGVTVDGIVMSGESKRSGRRSRSYNLEVAYATKEGSNHKKSIKVSSSFYKSIGSDGVVTKPIVPVVYLRSNPSEAIIKDGSPFNPEFQWIGPLISLAGIGYLGYRIRALTKS